MKILHLSFHKGCINEINYVCNQLNINCEVLSSFKECNTNKHIDPIYENNGQHYQMTQNRANKYYQKYKDYFSEFDCIITSDTAPLSRILLQNNWNKPLIIWICNRFDYAVEGDQHYYNLLRNSNKNVRYIGYTEFENYYCNNIRNVKIGNLTITPSGGISENYNNFTNKPYLNNTIFIPPYHNDTKMMNLTKKLQSIGLKSYTGKYDGPMDLLNYKCVVHIPYAWSNLAFFESFQLGIVYFIPTIDFFNKLRIGKYFFWSPPFINNLLFLSEWYNPKFNNLIIKFNSWEDLVNKINTLDYEKHKLKLKEFGNTYKQETINKWKDILK
jgi:hypothetical protein